MRRILPILAACLIFPATATAATVGTSTVGPGFDTNTPGRSQDYRFTAVGDGTVNRLSVYLTSSSTADKVEVGLYTNSSGRASTRLARCVVTTPTAGWNRCAVDPVTVVNGRAYWLAVLHPSGGTGTIRYADSNKVTQADRARPSFGSANGSLTLLPASWSNGEDWSGHTPSLLADATGTPPPLDTDGDGVPDSSDACPTVPGPASNGGCPIPPPSDTDGDGVPDSTDQCPNDPGPASNNGCPVTPPPTDTDGDGVSDDQDQCPNEPGPATNNGCPVPPPPGAFPSASSTGVPAGWTPNQTLSSLTITQAGAVIEDVQVNGDVNVDAPNVTLRRVKVRGGMLDTMRNGHCGGNGLVVEDSTFEPPGGPDSYWPEDQFHVGQGGYTLRNVKVWRDADGPRVGGSDLGCGPVNIEDSYINVDPTAFCGQGGHSDGIQAYGALRLNVTHSTVHMPVRGCGGNAGFFYPGPPDNSSSSFVTVNGLLIYGNPDNFSFRIGVPGSIQGLKIVNNSWGYDPFIITDGACPSLNPWDAKVVEADMSTGEVTSTVRDLPKGC